MSNTIKASVCAIYLEKQGILAHMVGTHYLRSGGAMALNISGKSDTTIMKFGRWSSLKILQYIHEHIAHLRKGVSTAMKKPLTFHNIGVIER